MAVDADIPLEETEMGPPLSNLSSVVARVDQFLSNLPADNRELFKRLIANAENGELSLSTAALSGN
jgi:hypothetical protein